MQAFEVTAIAIEESEDLNLFAIDLAEDPTESANSISLQRSLRPSEQDCAHGLDTYCLTVPSGETAYRAIVACTLDVDVLTIRLGDKAAAIFGVDGFEMTLKADPASIGRLKDALRRMFPSTERPATFSI